MGRRLLVLACDGRDIPVGTANGASLLRRPALPPLLDGRNQLAFAHSRGAGDAHRLGDALKFGQQHRRQSPGWGDCTRGIRADLVAACGRVNGIRHGAYRAGSVVGSPGGFRSADRWAIRPGRTRSRQVSRIPVLGREQVQGFAHKGSFPGCGSRLYVPLARCRVAICHRRLLAGRPGRGSEPHGSTLTRSLGRAGQTGNSHDGQMNVEIARRRALGTRPEGVRTSTSPRGGASGATTSLTPS